MSLAVPVPGLIPAGAAAASATAASAAAPGTAGRAPAPAAAAAPAEAAASTGWSIVPSPNGTARQGTFSGVSCVSATRCIAIGLQITRTGDPVPLAEVWNGKNWAVQRLAKLPAGTGLSAVSCSSATSCTAVGRAAEHWNGRNWVAQALPGDAAGVLDVSCRSAKSCLAVGLNAAATWNGSKWASHPPKIPAGFIGVGLTSVSCMSASACTAVGDKDNGDHAPERALVEAWNGTKWAIQPIPVPPGPGSSALHGVSCPTTAFCLTVGHAGGGPVAETWNGTTWQPAAVPAGGPSTVLNSVSCPSAKACVAVGFNSAGTLAETWDGSSWHVTPTPALAASNLLTVSCAAATACTAVGVHVGLTLAESWNGSTWTVEPSISPRGALSSELDAVSCPSNASCLAVGSDGKPLAETWNGSTWRLTPAPPLPAGASSGALDGVSCLTASDCMAVGFFDGGPNEHTLAEHWDGTRWTIEATPAPFGAIAELTGVSCSSPAACTAAGEFLDSFAAGHTEVPLAEFWNGTAWSSQTVPTPSGASGSRFKAVSCRPAGACTAAGDYGTPTSGGTIPLVERWNGTAWSIQPVPIPANGNDFTLNGVWCRSATACTAVGNGHIGSAHPLSMLAESWNGGAWALEPVPSASARRSFSPRAVSCTSGSACTAVGSVNRFGVQRLLALHWDGTTWAIQQSPSLASTAVPLLFGLSCRSATACTAVGRRFAANGISRTLAERHS